MGCRAHRRVPSSPRPSGRGGSCRALWCELVQRGADPTLLRQQAIITPECGLASHTPAVAERVHRFAAEVGRRVRDQATASRWVLGA